MKAFKRILLLGGAVAAMAGGAAQQAQAQKADQITVAITEGITGNNPYADSVVLIGSIWCQVYGCLTRWDFETGKFVPFLAESLEPEDDLNWILTLRSDWKRHNGEPVVAADVVHSIDRSRNDPESMSQASVQYIEKAEILDERRLRITTTQKMATLPNYLATMQVTSKKIYDQHGAKAADREYPFGAGPYRLVEVGIGSHIVIERVDDHPMVEPTNPKRIIYRMMAEPEQRVTALANGEIQIAQGIPPQLVGRVQQLPNATAEMVDSAEAMFIAMSPKTKPWDDSKVRQAVCHAINREGIARAILGNQVTLLNGPVGEGQFGFDPGYVSPIDYNPEKARKLLEEAGAVGAAVDLYSPVGRYIADRQIAEAVIPMLEDVGFKATLQTPEWGTLWTNVQRGETPFYYMGRGNMLDPSPALAQYFETDASPRLKYSNPQVDALLQAERQEFDPEKRIAMLSKAMAAITEDAPACFLWLHKLSWGVAKGVDYKPSKADRVNGWEIHLR
ncbi:peptide ABC transporter substrate-binding protein [Rhizobium sp. Root73]|uniref:ABC transporter substrate-binding protein n=1 Tax=unclassified Rhizobium TaxID=2613769 RepID=UPI000726CDAF|nr:MULTISPECIES: ABC transporter substrate-binding protein [unclassified Rhizobium]KQY16676.1 peptide ABC transporter substrate-binding protein [Rhizobium sp. Root1334]KRC11244.1 peptide ABC transporter substrate-binding protein [Rhizobium sp. Root73]